MMINLSACKTGFMFDQYELKSDEPQNLSYASIFNQNIFSNFDKM
jgi:hypothetical protein